MTLRVPNFRDMVAFVLHPDDRNLRALTEQLRRLEVGVRCQWPPEAADLEGIDVLFFDVDRGYDGMFPWRRQQAPVPTIAMVGSETPGRLEWVIGQAPSAYLLEPIGSQGAFQALTVAFDTFQRELERTEFLKTTLERVNARPHIVKAVLLLMERHGLTDDEAFALLRTASMRLRVTIERYAQMIAGGAVPESADLVLCRGADPGAKLSVDRPLSASKARNLKF